MSRPPSKRNPAVVNGGVKRKKSGLVGTETKTYNQGESHASVAVYSGRTFIGTIDEVVGEHHAFAAVGTPLGSFKTRIAAARAFGGVQS